MGHHDAPDNASEFVVVISSEVTRGLPGELFPLLIGSSESARNLEPEENLKPELFALSRLPFKHACLIFRYKGRMASVAEQTCATAVSAQDQ